MELNVILLNSVISACQRAARWQAALDIVVHAKTWSLQPNIVSYNSLAAACGGTGGCSWQAALAVLVCAQGNHLQLDARSFTALIQSCIPLGHWQACLVFLQLMVQTELAIDAFACGAAVRSCEQSGQWTCALYMWQSYAVSEMTADTCDEAGNWQVPAASAMSVCSRASKWDSSLQVLEDVARFSTPNVVVFGAAFSSLERGSVWPAAQKLLGRMRTSTVAANVYVYTTAMSGFEKAGKWELVFGTFAEMLDQRVMPTSVTYDVLLRTCRHSVRWQHALHIMYCMMPDSSVAPTARSTSALLSALDAALLWPLSIQILHMMPAADIASFSTAASTCEKSSAWQAAVAICARAADLGLKSDDVSNGVLISAWEKGRAWQMAITTLMSFSQESLQPSDISFAAMLRACQACVCWAAAVSLFGISPSGWTKTGLCNPVMGACATGQQWEIALSLFVEATHASLQADMVAVTTAMSACEAGLKWQQAIAILSSALESSLLPDPTACNVAISCCAKILNWRAALALLGGQALSSVSDAWPDVVSYNAALGSCKQEESWRKALTLLHNMQSQNIGPNSTTFHGVLEACACGHAWEVALVCLTELADLRLPTGIATNLAASACQQAAEYQKAGALLATVLEDAPEASGSVSDPVTLKTVLDIAEADCMGRHAMPCMEALSAWAEDQLSTQEGKTLRASDMQGAGQAVVAAELLQWHGYLYGRFWSHFVRLVGCPVKSQLKRLCCHHPGHQARLQDPILERQFGLSPLFSRHVLCELGMRRYETWVGCPRLAARRCSLSVVSTGLEPTSKHLAAWASWALFSDDIAACKSRCHGYAAVLDAAKPLLRPVQVQHDRRPHAERQLLQLLVRDTWTGSLKRVLPLMCVASCEPSALAHDVLLLPNATTWSAFEFNAVEEAIILWPGAVCRMVERILVAHRSLTSLSWPSRVHPLLATRNYMCTFRRKSWVL